MFIAASAIVGAAAVRCGDFDAKIGCAAQEACRWSDSGCVDECSAYADEQTCSAIGARCGWTATGCESTSSCDDQTTKSACQSLWCLWDATASRCFDYDEDCDVYPDETTCKAATSRCLWYDDSCQVDPSPLLPATSSCDDQTTKSACQSLWCLWDSTASRCFDYDEDCDVYPDETTCKAAHSRCLWLDHSCQVDPSPMLRGA